MDCGADWAQCFLLASGEHEALPEILQAIGQTLGIADLGSFQRWWGVLQALFAISGICVGVYFRWRHSERQLHNTLLTYLKRSDQRLAQGQAYVLDAIQRPGPGQPPTIPLFIVGPLRKILKRHNWDRTFFATSSYASCDMQLASAIELLDEQIKIARERLETYQDQLAAAQVIRGALSAATPTETPDSLNRQISALTCFEAALKIDGQDKNFVARELEAHQLRKLGQFDDALIAYGQLERVANNLADDETKDLIIARAKRYQAEIRQAQAIEVQSNGRLSLTRSLKAYQLLKQALELREKHDPYVGWDLLEQADMHYLMSLVARTSKYSDVTPRNLMAAIGAYDAVSKEPLPLFWKRRAKMKLRRLATEGFNRATKAQDTDEYDRFWLLPPSLRHQAKQQTDGISDGGGHQRVAGTLQQC